MGCKTVWVDSCSGYRLITLELSNRVSVNLMPVPVTSLIIQRQLVSPLELPSTGNSSCPASDSSSPPQPSAKMQIQLVVDES